MEFTDVLNICAGVIRSLKWEIQLVSFMTQGQKNCLDDFILKFSFLEFFNFSKFLNFFFNFFIIKTAKFYKLPKNSIKIHQTIPHQS